VMSMPINSLKRRA